MNWETLLCLGDSITIGARSYAGYPEYAAAALAAALEKDFNVVNCAVSGYTAMDLLRHVDREMSSLLAQKPDIITLLIGTNDIKNNTHPDNYRMTLRLLLFKCALLVGNKNVVQFYIPRLADGMKYPYTTGMNEQIFAFNRIIEEETTRHGIRTMQLSLLETDFFDGVHLNEQGCRHAGDQLASLILRDKGFSPDRLYSPKTLVQNDLEAVNKVLVKAS